MPGCTRYTNMNAKSKKKWDDCGLSFQVLTFILTMNCTLNCRYCGQMHSKLPKELRRNFAKESILRDIDHVMGAVDFVGMISLIGGEPFVHPDLAEIVEHIVHKWDNYGIIGITTNGVFRVSEEIIRRLNHPRVVINFSLYEEFLNQEQRALLARNMDEIKKTGISLTVSHPVWQMPAEYQPHNYTVSDMERLKTVCTSPKMCATVQNGFFIPCSAPHNIMNLGLYDVSNDLVDVTCERGLRQRLIENLERTYYHSCVYCSDQATPQVPAGEQL